MPHLVSDPNPTCPFPASGAGGAAHLPGMVASMTPLPVSRLGCGWKQACWQSILSKPGFVARWLAKRPLWSQGDGQWP